MFGITHCVHFSCIMNGANSLKESDEQPLHLCPVCLRKLHRGAGFDVEARYRTLLAFYGKVGLDEEARWTRRRLARIRGLTSREPVDSK
jgi:archaemetzincin